MGVTTVRKALTVLRREAGRGLPRWRIGGTSGGEWSGPVPRGRAPVLGIELTRGGLRFVELQTVGGRPACLSHGEIAYGTTEDLGGVLKFLIADNGIRARDVHVVDSTSRANLKIQSLPEMPDSDIDAVARGEIEAEAELLGDALVGDWSLLQRRSGQVEILVGKAPARDRDLLLAACSEAGLRLQVMATSSVVLANHFVVTGEVPAGEMVGLLDIGRTKMNMALVSDDHILLVREVYQGLSAKFLADRNDEDTPDLDMIGEGLDEIIGTVEQIRRTLTQYQESRPDVHLHHLIMTGETTRISQLLGLLQHDLQVPVKSYDPARGLNPALLPDTFAPQAATFAVPWVLAQTPAAAFPLNFAEGVPDMRPVRATQGAAVAAAIGAVVIGVAQGRASGALAREEAARVQLESRKTYLETELGLIDEAKFDWQRWVDTQAHDLGLPPPDFHPYLAMVAQAMPSGVRLLRTEFGRSAPGWTLEVDALAFSDLPTDTHAAMRAFVDRITASPLTADVRLRPVKYEFGRASRGADEVQFSLQIRLRRIASPPGETS